MNQCKKNQVKNLHDLSPSISLLSLPIREDLISYSILFLNLLLLLQMFLIFLDNLNKILIISFLLMEINFFQKEISQH